MARPKNVRTEELWALQRGGLCEAKFFSWIFGRIFFATFFLRKKNRDPNL
jgi:hypothetical protein